MNGAAPPGSSPPQVVDRGGQQSLGMSAGFAGPVLDPFRQ